MKIAALYDIHGNLPALDAVLAEVEARAVDTLVIGGDVIAGPMPAACLDRLQQLALPTYFIHGNHESEVLRYLDTGDPGGLSQSGDAVSRWVAGVLSAEQIAWIRTWPMTVTLRLAGLGNVLFCHANPQDDVTVFTEQTPAERVREVLGSVSAEILVCGHTHMQFDRTVDQVRILNAGSVGLPFGAVGAHWLLLDGDVEFMRSAYDYAQAADMIRATDYPTATAFAEGNILSAPASADAINRLQQIEAQQIAQQG